MAARKPLVVVAGQVRELPVGDTVTGMPMYVPAYQQSGAMLRLAFISNYGLAVLNAAGANLSVQVVPNG